MLFIYMLIRAEQVRFSPREAGIAALICEGFSVPEIVDKLGMGRGTYSCHISRIYKGLEISNRVELLLWCLQNPRALIHREWADYRLHELGCACDHSFCTYIRGRLAEPKRVRKPKALPRR